MNDEVQLVLEPTVAEHQAGSSLNSAKIVRQLRDRHWTMLIASIVILGLSLVLSVQDSGTTSAVTIGGVELPPMCGSRYWFETDCPGCGLTRSFIALSSGDLTKSIQFHRVGWLLWIAVVLQIPYRIFCLREMRHTIVQRQWPTWIGSCLIAVLIGNWTLKTIGV